MSEITVYSPQHHLSLDALAIDMPALPEPHPNRHPFRGVLCRLDEPSTRAPSGSRGHRVLLPASVAERALPSLLGMAVNVSANVKDHAPTRKIGVITSAEIEGRDLVVSGFLYAKDFPREVAHLRAQKSVLGMSYEISHVSIADPEAKVWQIEECIFTGASILTRHSAAYQQTAFAAQRERIKKESSMSTKLRERLDTLREHIDLLGAEEGEEEPMTPDDTTEDQSGDLAAAIELLAEAVKDLRATPRQKPAPKLASKPKGKARMASRMQALLAQQETEEEDDDDTTADLDMLEEMIRLYRQSHMSAQAKKHDDRLAQIEASVGLLTDSVNSMRGLLTDIQSAVTGLATDRQATDQNGGQVDVPVRKTMSASDGAYWMSKFPIDHEKTYTTAEIDQVLKNAGVDDPTQRVAVKHQLEANGRLV